MSDWMAAVRSLAEPSRGENSCEHCVTPTGTASDHPTVRTTTRAIEAVDHAVWCADPLKA